MLLIPELINANNLLFPAIKRSINNQVNELTCQDCTPQRFTTTFKHRLTTMFVLATGKQ